MAANPDFVEIDWTEIATDTFILKLKDGQWIFRHDLPGSSLTALPRAPKKEMTMRTKKSK